MLIWPPCIVEGCVHEGNGSHPVTLENRQTVVHREAQVVFGSQVPRGVCTGCGLSSCLPHAPCPEGMSIKRKTEDRRDRYY